MKTNALLGLVVLVLLGCGLGWKLRTPRVAAQVVTPPPLAVQQTMSPETQKLLAPVNTSRFAGLPSAPELPLLSRPLQPGDVAPDFELQDQNGVTHHLWDSRGKTVVLSFYPKDQTQSCVSSAVSLSRAKPIFEAQDTVVYGVSVQPVASKKAFANRFGIQFPLLADDDKNVTEKYGVLSQSGLAGRVTFVIGPDGRIASTDQHVHAATHAKDVISVIDSLHRH